LIIALAGVLIGVPTASATPKKTPKKTTPKPPPEPLKPTTPEPTPATPTTPEPAKPDPTPATPAAPTTPAASTEVKVEASGDVDALRQEYLSLRDELFKSRARANAVASQLYSTRVTIKLTYTTARYYNPAKSSIRLDGANVYEDATGAIAGDDGVRFDGYVAPGKHLITFHVEANGKDDDSFTSTTETQIVVKAVANKDLEVSAKAKDTGDIAYEWKRKERGTYGLGIDVSVKTQPHAEGAAAAPVKK
jgi:hypothetical protein